MTANTVNSQTAQNIAPNTPVLNEDAKQRLQLTTNGALIAKLYTVLKESDEEKSPAPAPKPAPKGKKSPSTSGEYTLTQLPGAGSEKEKSMVLIMCELTAMIAQLTGMSMKIDNDIMKVHSSQNSILQEGCNRLLQLGQQNMVKINKAIAEENKHHSWLDDLMKVVAVVALVASVFVGPGAFAFAAFAFAMTQTPLGAEVTKGLEAMGMSPGLAQGVLMVTMMVAGVALGGITSAEEAGEMAAEEGGSAAEGAGEGASEGAGGSAPTEGEANVEEQTSSESEDELAKVSKKTKIKYNAKIGARFGAANALTTVAGSPEMNKLIQLCLVKLGHMNKQDAEKIAGYIQIGVEFVAAVASAGLMSSAASKAAEDAGSGLSALARSRITLMLSSLQIAGTLGEAGVYFAQAEVQKTLAAVQKENGQTQGNQSMNTLLQQLLQRQMQESTGGESATITSFNDMVSELQGFLAVQQGETYATSGMLQG